MAVLFVIQGDDQGRRFELSDRGVTLGRDQTSDIHLQDTEISRRHAEIRPTQSGYELIDLGSSNGSYVNQQQVSRCELNAGDRIQLGHTLLIYTIRSKTGSQPPVDFKLDASAREGSRIIRSLSHEEGSQIFVPRHPAGGHGSSAPSESISSLTTSTASTKENLQLIYHTALAISRTLDIDQLLDYILGLIFDWVDADRACIMLLDPHTKTPELKAHRLRDDRADQVEPITMSRTILDYVLEHREGVITSDARDDQRWAAEDSIISYGIREAICVPMQGRYGIVGAINIDTYTPPRQQVGGKHRDRFTEEHLKLMVAIGHQAALAVEDTHYYSAVVRSERLAAMGQAVAAISHHAKNILQGIQGGGYIVDEGLKNGQLEIVQRGWAIVSRNQERIANLVMDMLSFSKEREPDRAPADLNDVAADVVSLMRARAEELGVSLRIVPDLDQPRALFDAEGFHRALLNVVTNAIDASAECETKEVTVMVGSEADPPLIYIQVRDTGPGVPPHLRERVFSAFESTKGNRGTGLGLPVTRKILQEHGGDITLMPPGETGSTFKLWIPLIEVPAPLEEPAGPFNPPTSMG
ncbi:MAG: ATP-binding protein [Pirellulaceae bacterium]